MGILHAIGYSIGIVSAICAVILLCLFLSSKNDIDWHYGPPWQR